MTAVVIALAQVLIAGLPAAVLLDRGAPRSRLAGMSYLLGTGISSMVLLLLSFASIPWTIVNVTVALLAVTVALWLAMLRVGTGAREDTPATGNVWIAAAFSLATLALVAAHARLATRTPVGEWDFWAIWGLKARAFFEHRGIDWAFLENPWYAFAHGDYPPLLPLQYALVSVNHGAWTDRYVGIVTTFFGAALILVSRGFFSEELKDRALVAMSVFCIAWIALPRWIGMAEAPFVALSTAGLLFVRRGHTARGAILLGLAGFTKNEGLTLIVAVAVALVVSGRKRELRFLWPAAALVAPWLLLRLGHDIPTPLVAGDLRERILANAARVSELVQALLEERPVQPFLWVAMGVVFVACASRLRRERFLLVAVAVQCLFYFGAYLGTPYGVQWHVHTSLPRLLQHAAAPLAFLALTLCGRRLSESTDDGDGNGDQRDDDGDGDDDRENHGQNGHADGEEHGHLDDEHDRQDRQEDQLERQQNQLEGELHR